MDSSKPKRCHDDYTVAWISPLEVELGAAIEMLDEEHDSIPQDPNDHNVYILGSINKHNVIIASLPTAGNCPAATVVTQMRNTFKQLRFGLLVGIGGGVPRKIDQGYIRLGHVVVSKPVNGHSGAIQYDHGKTQADGQFHRTGALAPPPAVLLNSAQIMSVRRKRARKDPLIEHLQRIDTTIDTLQEYKYPGLDQDYMYQHDLRKLQENRDTLSSKRIKLDLNADECPKRIIVHNGTIASGEKVLKNEKSRDVLAEQYDILCFEMEAAGALNDFPCMIIRGISDYADSHKNDAWQGFAAAAAAAYARELFFHMPVEQVKQCGIPQSGQ